MANANVLNFPGSGQTVEAQQAEFCWRPRCLFQLEQREQTWKGDELWAVCKRCGLRRAFLSSRHDHMLAFLRHLATAEDAPAQWELPDGRFLDHSELQRALAEAAWSLRLRLPPGRSLTESSRVERRSGEGPTSVACQRIAARIP
jgi:hypothetical protein